MTTSPPSRIVARLALALAVLPFLLVSPASAEFFDDFNDGDDAGWTRYEPLASFGGGGIFSFPAGGYRIQALASPNPVALGRARVGSLRLDQIQTDFLISVDVINWDNALNQAFGLLARFRQIGLGTSDGYLLVANPNENGPGSGQLILARADNEATTRLAFADISLDPAEDYRLVFAGNGPSLSGQIFALDDLTTPLVALTATDAAYASGSPGLLAGASATSVTSPADATFDNFRAVPEPASFVLLALGGLGFLARHRVQRR